MQKLQADGKSLKGSPFCKRGHLKEFKKDCRECNRLRSQKWYYEDLERSRSRAIAYHLEHRDEQNAKMRAHAKANRPKVSAQQKAWRERNKDKQRTYFREKYRSDPVGRGKRRARLRGCKEHHTKQEWEAVAASQGGKCLICGLERKLARDHIIPLSLGGSDTIDNIQGLCGPCNSRKGARLKETI